MTPAGIISLCAPPRQHHKRGGNDANPSHHINGHGGVMLVQSSVSIPRALDTGCDRATRLQVLRALLLYSIIREISTTQPTVYVAVRGPAAAQTGKGTIIKKKLSLTSVNYVYCSDVAGQGIRLLRGR